MASNKSLSARKGAPKDEFYTQLSDIEAELRHYAKHFRGKTILCNCDDPYESNFFKYFAMNFNHLGLRKSDSWSAALIARPSGYPQRQDDEARLSSRNH